MARFRSFQLVMLLVLGVLLCGCSLSLTPTTSSNTFNATPSPSTSTALEPTSIAAPTRRATTRPRASATSRPRRTATAQRATPRATARPRNTPAASRASVTPAVQVITGFRTISADRLPREARQTLALIEQGGPFPYRQDGVVFQNRERRLPRQSSGYYHEYTVVTPGEGDRGARRIITGANGERFYTDDHYESFVQVLP